MPLSLPGRNAAVCVAAFAALLGPFGVVAANAQEPTGLVVGVTLEPPHLDPTSGAAAAIDEVVFLNVFEGLTRITEDGSIVPALAEDWTVSDDGLEYTFRLRQDVTFHDGTTFDSDDVRYTFERAMAEGSVNAQPGYFAAIDTIETPSPDSVVLRLSRPDGPLLFHLGNGDMAIVAPESAETNQTNPVGTGPFRFVDRVEGDRITLARYPEYWDASVTDVETLTFRVITDPAAQVAGLLSGDVDLFPNLAAPEALQRLEEDERFEVVIGTTEGETLLALNLRRPPFDDIRVRQAIVHALDRRAIIDGAMFGYGVPIGSHFAPHHPAYIDLNDLYPYDPERARALLVEAGLAEGFSANLVLPPPSYARRSGEIVQAQLAQVGITVELEPVEWAQWLEQAFRGFDYDMTIVSHTEPLDIDIFARGSTEYYFGYDNPTFNAIIADLSETVDPQSRASLYGAAQEILAQDVAAVWLFQLAKAGVRRADLTGVWENAPIQVNDMTRVRLAQ